MKGPPKTYYFSEECGYSQKASEKKAMEMVEKGCWDRALVVSTVTEIHAGEAVVTHLKDRCT